MKGCARAEMKMEKNERHETWTTNTCWNFLANLVSNEEEKGKRRICGFRKIDMTLMALVAWDKNVGVDGSYHTP